MESRNLASMQDWRGSIFVSILRRHHIELTDDEIDQINYIYDAIAEFKTSCMDMIEILRLFDTALSQWDRFVIGAQLLTHQDLFYGSAIVGIKLCNEITPYKLMLTDINQALSKQSDYYSRIEESVLIERIFLRGINWDLQAFGEGTGEAYLRLLEGVDVVDVKKFAASYLLTVCTSSGNQAIMMDVLSKLLGLSIYEKAQAVIEYIKNLPLLSSFIDDRVTRSLLKDDIFEFINSNDSVFGVSLKTYHCIQSTIADYYTHQKKEIQPWQIKELTTYFTPEQIHRIQCRSASDRLNGLFFKKQRSIGNALQHLMKDILSYRVDLTWLLPLLENLEALDKNAALTEWMMEAIFKDINKSEFVTFHFISLLADGWLKVINSKKDLQNLVSDLISEKYQDSDLRPDIKRILEDFMAKNKPSLRLLAHLNESATSNVARSFSDALIYSRYITTTAIMLQRVRGEPTYKSGIFESLDVYFTSHLNERIKWLFNLALIKNEVIPIDKSLAIDILSNPERLNFYTVLVYNLIETFLLFDLNTIPTQFPGIYKDILRSLHALPLSLDLEYHFSDLNDARDDDELTVFETIIRVKREVRRAIDSAIDNQSIVLSDDEVDNLKKFYRVYRMTIVPSRPNYGTLNSFFSPKLAVAASPTPESPVKMGLK